MASETRNRAFSLLIKPASADCNLSCDYCFYLPKASLYPLSTRHRMSDEVLERVISTYLATEQPVYSFGWQGGEPTLMGVSFFRKVVELERRHGRPGSIVANGLQTNATLISNELAALFAQYKFLLGVSLDGPQPIHDRFRTGIRDQGSHRRVMQGIEILKGQGVQFNVLVAVSAANVADPEAIYRYLVDRGVLYHQYIPIVELDRRGEALPFSIRGEQWGRFLIGLFDLWLADAGRVSVRLFDAILTSLVDEQPILCTMGRDCRQYFLVEHNGDVYPCDFFVQPELRLGNIGETDWQTLLDSRLYAAFGRRKALWSSVCEACPHLELCLGDCLKHRPPTAGQEPQPSRLCEGWRMFYEHSLPGFRRIARRLRKQRSREILAALGARRAP